MTLFRCRASCDLSDLTFFNITSFDEIMSMLYSINRTSSCYSYIGNLLMKMNDQNVEDVSKVNQNLASSYDSSIPISTQIKNQFDSINPVFYKIIMRMFNSTYEFGIGDLVYVKRYLRNTTVFNF